MTILVVVKLNELDTVPSSDVLRNVHRETIVHALEQHGGNVTHAALALGTTRQSLQRRMRRLGVCR